MILSKRSSLIEEFNINVLDSQNSPNALIGLHLFTGILFSYWILYDLSSDHLWYYHIFYLVFSIAGGFFFLVTIIATDYVYKNNVKEIKIQRKLLDENKTIDFSNKITNIFNLEIDIEPEKINLDLYDENDAKIIEIESKVKMIGTKVESYLLESILLGGLSFSGFLTIISGDNFNASLPLFNNFYEHILKCKTEMVNLTYTDFYNNLDNSFSVDDLLVIIMILSLICSVFFLLVITLRIRYMDLTLKIDHLLRSLIAFNSKEEDYLRFEIEKINLDDKNKSRLNLIRKKIDEEIIGSNLLLNQLNPIVRLMSICRNMAIFLFFIILIFSGLFLSKNVSIMILLIALLVVIFRFIESISSVGKVNKIFSNRYIHFINKTKF